MVQLRQHRRLRREQSQNGSSCCEYSSTSTSNNHHYQRRHPNRTRQFACILLGCGLCFVLASVTSFYVNTRKRHHHPTRTRTQSVAGPSSTDTTSNENEDFSQDQMLQQQQQQHVISLSSLGVSSSSYTTTSLRPEEEEVEEEEEEEESIFTQMQSLLENPSQLLDTTTAEHHLEQDVQEEEEGTPTPTRITPIVPSSSFTVDIISVGISTRNESQQAQAATFGRHPAVRYFLPVTELHDSDRLCHSTLTAEDVRKIHDFCHNDPKAGAKVPETLRLIRERTFRPDPEHPPALCAQRRLFDGLRLLFHKYEWKGDRLPDVLLFLHDDTYVHLDATLEFLQTNHANTTIPYALAGCRLANPKKLFFTHPHGQYGSLLTKAALQNLLRPIGDCTTSSSSSSSTHMGGGEDRWNEYACWRLQQNTLQEAQFVKDTTTTSVIDILFAMLDAYPWTQHGQWANAAGNGGGYCYTADILLAYMVGYYYTAVPPDVLLRRSISDNVRVNFPGFTNLGNSKQHHQCAVFPTETQCKVEEGAKFCHPVGPEDMLRLWKDTTSTTIGAGTRRR